MTYLAEKKLIDDETVAEENQSFNQQLVAIVREQNARINQSRSVDNEPRRINYLAVIRALYQSRRFKLAENAKRFRKNEHDGFTNPDLLCLREKALLAKIRTINASTDIDDAIRYLKSHNALKTSKDRNTLQIHGAGRGLRFYAIKLGMLQ